VFAVTVLASGPSNVGAAGDVHFRGTTSCYIDYKDTHKLRPDEAYYEPLTDVEVNVVAPEQVKDVSKPGKDKEGRDVASYKFSVSPGPPVCVLYHHPTSDKGFVPVLKSLSGESNRRQQVHVTLLTKRQYIDRFGEEILKADMEQLYRKLKQLKVDEGTLRTIRDHLQTKLRVSVE